MTASGANRRAELAQLRPGLGERLADSPLCNAPRFVRHLEAAYREMWAKAVKGRTGMSQRVIHRLIWLLLGLLLALVLASVGLFLWLIRPEPPRPGVMPENVERVTAGMKPDEVEQLLGLKYPPRMRAISAIDAGLNVPEAAIWALLFSDKECDIWVYLDADDTVLGCEGVGDRCHLPGWQLRLTRRLAPEER